MKIELLRKANPYRWPLSYITINITTESYVFKFYYSLVIVVLILGLALEFNEGLKCKGEVKSWPNWE